MTDDHPLSHLAKQIGDASAMGITLAAIASWLPSLATVLSIAWLLLRFYDRFKYGPEAKRKN